MNSACFIDRVKSILKDNCGVRKAPHKLSGPALDTPHLALADAGERRIFSQPERRMFRDYYVHLLIDVSGSMDGSRIKHATIATHALHYALQAAGAVMSASTFNRYYNPIPTKTIEDIDKLYTALRTPCQSSGSGCTHTAYAIDQACKALNAATSAPSRIILVMTDGGACCSSCGKAGGDDTEGRYYGHAIKACERSIRQARETCAVLAVGIEDAKRAIEVFGAQEACSIDHSSELYPAALKLLSGAVRRG